MRGSGGREGYPPNGIDHLAKAIVSPKERKREKAHAEHHKLKGEVAVQREILAKAEKKATRRAE